MSNSSTIWESFTLPSKGLIYEKDINPVVELRSMTTLEEMERLSPSDTPYKVMCTIIEECMREKPEIPVYNMCIGDYQFLMHKLRIVTYGPEYKMIVNCPKCGEITESVGDLESLELHEYEENIAEIKQFTLPVTNDEITIKFQTPRDLDMVSIKNKEEQKRTKSNIDFSLLFTVTGIIDKINGRKLNSIQLEEYVKNLPMKDVNYIISRVNELNKKIGLDTLITVKCSSCGYELVAPFRITSEFFGPSNN